MGTERLGASYVPPPRRAHPRRRPRIGLLAKISLSLLAVGLLPLATAAFRLVHLNRDAMTEQVLRTHAVAAQATASRVEAFLSARQAFARAAASSSMLNTDPRSRASTELLADFLRSPFGVVAVSIRTPTGAEVIRVQQRGAGEQVELALGASSTEELLFVPRGDGAHTPRLRLALPLSGIEASLLVLFDLTPLGDELHPEELGDQADLVLLDRGGAVVSGSGAARFPEEMVRLALSGRISGSGRFADTRGAALGAYAPVPGTPWVVLSRQPAEVAEALAIQMKARAGASVAVALLVVLLTTVVARRSIVEPIRSLLAAQQRLAGGGPGSSASGEIEQLRETFALLERRLRDREALGEVSLGRYRVESVVGEGAMGTVFRAWDPTLKRSVAIKTVRFDRWAENERADLARRLLNEAVTVARFNHPHIVGLYDIQESPEVAFLTMEYVDGSSLEQYLADCDRLPVDQALAIALAVGRALAAAHERDVVHHDVKPANVLLGRDGAVKVTDFGISQILSTAARSDGSLMGTPGFIPPEALLGEPCGPRGDLFALGAMLYRMLTGEMPFPGRSLQDVLNATLTREVAPPSTRCAAVPEALDPVVASLLEKDPEQRCPSAADAVRRLEERASKLGSSDLSATSERPADARGERTVRMSCSS